ncbi:MAG: dynamin family protein [Desulfococcaceae bacterium]
MIPKTYETLRNELIFLLQKAATPEAVNRQTRELLFRICRRAQENQFEIVLAGEFQGGKSTTFNALCEGRELSPMGSGIRTSGCLVSAQNISDSDEAESAEVQWRSSAELTEGFSDLLLPHFRHLAPKRFEKATASELSQLLNLEDPADRRLLAQSADREWKIWKKDKSGYDPEQSGLLDVLRCASLIAYHFGNLELADLREKKFRPEDVSTMIRFPQDWEERWFDNRPDSFQLSEVLFVFISRICLKIHSPSLGRLGCVITDCPGLSASRWDTHTARQAMFRADAILYLFDGSKTLKLSDLRALDFIRRNGMAGRLFYGCNMRGHSLEDSKRILRASVTSLKNSGFSIAEEKQVSLFHALLSLRAVQAANLSETDPDFHEKADRLRKILVRQMAVLELEESDIADRDFSALVKNAGTAGGLEHLRSMAEQAVISRKAASVLIENGAKAAADCLGEIEGNLHARENAAFREEKDFRRQIADAEAELRKFQSACTRILEGLRENGADAALAEDVWMRIDARRQELCNTVSERIYREVLNKVSFSLLSGKGFQDRISGIIKAETEACFTETVHAWITEVREGRNPVYNSRIVRRVRAVSRELKHAWSSSALPGMQMTEGTVLPEFSGDLDVDTAAIVRELESGPALENIRYSALLAAGGVTGIFTAASGILLAVYMLITRLFWVRIATVAVFVVNMLLVMLTKGMMEKSMKQDIHRKLEPALHMLFSEMEEDVKKEFRNFSQSIRQFYLTLFQQAGDKPARIFEQRKKQAENDFRKSRESRISIAGEARRIRETEIAPLRMALEDFIFKTSQLISAQEKE